MANREVTPEQAARLLEAFNFGEVAARTTDRIRPGLVERMRIEAPYSTLERSSKKDQRHLRDTIYAVRQTVLGGGQLEVLSNSDHAHFVVHGTKEHEIHPKGVSPSQPVGTGGHPLVFFWEKVGQVVASFGWHGSPYGFARHPGTKPNRFNQRAWLLERKTAARTLAVTAREQFMKGRL